MIKNKNKSFHKLISKIPLANIIVFESYPVFTDNPKAIYDELLKRDIYHKYKYIWIDFDGYKKYVKNKNQNTKIITYSNINIINKAIIKFYLWRAKLLISGNRFFIKENNKQYYFFASHGTALKNTSDYYNLPKDVDSFLSNSRYFSKYDSQNLKASINKCVCLGFPRTDLLFKQERLDLNALFNSDSFNKTIIWMPTFRRYGNGKNVSSIKIPIIKDNLIAARINEFCKKNKTLLIIMPHFIEEEKFEYLKNLTNILVLNNSHLLQNNIDFYSILKETAGLISDYSSVIIDYLLLDKPIGLCWEDYEEYNKNVGFVENSKEIFNCGYKIYSESELYEFIKIAINNKIDNMYDKRKKIKEMVFDHLDGKSSERVVDYLLNKIE